MPFENPTRDTRLHRLPIVGVMGAGSTSIVDIAIESLCVDVGNVVAELGCHLLTGGGFGVMESVAKTYTAYRNRRGLSIGIVRPNQDWKATTDGHGQDSPKYSARAENNFLDVVIRTHLPSSDTSDKSRNHINVLTADVCVFLPGGSGTHSELELAVKYRRPIVCYLGTNSIDGRVAADLATSYEIAFATNPKELTSKVEQFLDAVCGLPAEATPI